mmetsp:Transcript_3763/g.8581  ORF Transcript_3763/g.8581 Transcript_3763/m.8581 type:complete len:265 (-) Transcript_3763:230-1024(-)
MSASASFHGSITYWPTIDDSRRISDTVCERFRWEGRIWFCRLASSDREAPAIAGDAPAARANPTASSMSKLHDSRALSASPRSRWVMLMSWLTILSLSWSLSGAGFSGCVKTSMRLLALRGENSRKIEGSSSASSPPLLEAPFSSDRFMSGLGTGSRDTGRALAGSGADSSGLADRPSCGGFLVPPRLAVALLSMSLTSLGGDKSSGLDGGPPAAAAGAAAAAPAPAGPPVAAPAVLLAVAFCCAPWLLQQAPMSVLSAPAASR